MKRFKKILFLLNNDFNPASPTFQRVLSLAETNLAELMLLRVLPHIASPAFEGALDMTLPEIEGRMVQDEAKKLDNLVAQLETRCTLQSRVLLGKNYLEAILLVLHEGYDLVIKVAEAPSWLDKLFGSDDMHLIRKCPCPLWIMKANEASPYKQIMAAVDFDQSQLDFGEQELNQTILELASSIALAEVADLNVINVFNAPAAGFISLWVDKPEQVEQQIQQQEYLLKNTAMMSLLDWLKKKLGDESYGFVKPTAQVVQGNAAQVLPELANSRRYDLVVMGTVGRSGIAGLIIGNTAESILGQLNCSVLVVKPAGFVSPVV